MYIKENNDNKYYPNGYQAQNATLTINQKIQNGYNKVEFEHRIFPGVTHSLNTVDWYYDDGHGEFGRKINGDSYQNNAVSQQSFIKMDERDSANHFLSWSWADGYNDDSLINILDHLILNLKNFEDGYFNKKLFNILKTYKDEIFAIKKTNKRMKYSIKESMKVKLHNLILYTY